jgi:type IV pilus assembly protein PilO
MALQTGLEDKPWHYGAIFGLLVGAGLYFAAHTYLLEPKRAELAALDAKLSELQTKIQEGLAAQKELPRFREEVRLLQLDLDRLLRILPARRNTPELLRRIRSLTEQGDFDFLRFRPGNFRDLDFYSEWPIHIQLNGTYHNLGLLFDRVSRFARIINIDGLSVAAVRSAGTSKTVSATFQIKTFVYREEEPVEMEPAG